MDTDGKLGHLLGTMLSNGTIWTVGARSRLSARNLGSEYWPAARREAATHRILRSVFGDECLRIPFPFTNLTVTSTDQSHTLRNQGMVQSVHSSGHGSFRQLPHKWLI